MKTWVKTFVVAVFCGGMFFNAASQINLDANTVQIRSSSNTYDRWTINYGDLSVDGGNEGSKRGWLHCNNLIVNASNQTSLINTHLKVFKDLDVSGVKRFIHPHPTDDSKVIRYIAIESAEALTLARGTAKTVNGEATVALPEHFSLVTSKEAPITVVLTPKGAPVLLYTKHDSREQIVVAMKKSDFTTFGDAEFSFQVTGVRDGFEKQEVIISEEKLNSPTYESEWQSTEVGKRINALAERVNTRQTERRLERK